MPTTRHYFVQPSNRQARFFYLSSDLRRAACWGIGGALLLAPVTWHVFAHVQQRGVFDQVCGVVILLLGAGWLSQYLFPRIRVDEEGISRRFLWMWDLWSWDEFASGTLRGGFDANQYVSVDRPWWRRTLTLGFLDSHDAAAIGDLIRSVWVPLPQKPIPETLTVRLSWPSRRCFHLSRNGVVTEQHWERRVYEWDEVVSLTIWRVEPNRHDFRELELVLPDQTFKLMRWRTEEQVEGKNWSACSPELLVAAMCQSLDVARIRDFALNGQPNNIEELEARYARKMVVQTQAVTTMTWCCRTMWGLVVCMPFLFPWPGWVGMSLLTILLAIPVQWLLNDTKLTVEELHHAHKAEQITLKAQHSQPSR